MTRDFRRDVVCEPFRNVTEALHRSHIRLFAQLAQSGWPRILAGIDAALRQLPNVGIVDVFGAADAAADKSVTGAIEHHEAGAKAVGTIFQGHADGD